MLPQIIGSPMRQGENQRIPARNGQSQANRLGTKTDCRGVTPYFTFFTVIKCILSTFRQQLICFHTDSNRSVPHPPRARFSANAHTGTDTFPHVRTLGQNQSARPGISHSSVLCLFLSGWRWRRTGRRCQAPNHPAAVLNDYDR